MNNMFEFLKGFKKGFETEDLLIQLDKVITDLERQQFDVMRQMRLMEPNHQEWRETVEKYRRLERSLVDLYRQYNDALDE